jgi:urocanate hydratase
MTSAGVTLVADGSDAAASRLTLALTNDTSLGIMRYADAGYPDAIDEARRNNIRHFALN